MTSLSSALLLIACGLYSAVGLAVPSTASSSAADITQQPRSPRAPLLERSVLSAQAVQLSNDADQLISLSTATEHFSALFLPANTATAQGLVILLPGVGETFDWPNSIGPLRRNLPDAGWHTLSLNLPEPPQADITAEHFIAEPVAEQFIVQPPAPIAEAPIEAEPAQPIIEEAPDPVAEPEEEPVAEEAISEEPEVIAETPVPTAPEPLPTPDYPERISNFIDAAIAYGQSINAAHIILLGQHEGAHWALDYQASHPASAAATVLISVRESRLASASVENLIDANMQPIADFYYKGNAQTESAARRRLNASRRAHLPAYQQISLSADAGIHSLEQEQLFRRVKGWLNKSFTNPW